MSTSKFQLVFLISQPRAGSTLTQRILGSHPEIYTNSEPWVMLHPLHAFKPQNLVSVFNSDIYSIALNDFVDQVPGGIEFYNTLIGEAYRRMYGAILAKENKSLFLDKTPRYYLIADELHKCFPDAKFILLWRNPAAVITSIINTWTKTNHHALVEFKSDLLEAPRMIVSFLQRKHQNVISVQYEQLLEQPELVMRNICSFLNLNFHHGMLTYTNKGQTGRYGDKGSIFQKNKPDVTHANRWQSSLSDGQLCEFVKEYISYLGEALIEEMGYSFNELKTTLDKTNLGSFETGKNLMSLKIILESERDLLFENTRMNATIKAQAALLRKKDLEIAHLKNKLPKDGVNT